MLIECYLFSEITQQIGHTYYSGLNHYHRILYFNLCDYPQDRLSFRMFIYKVKVDSNDVYNLFQTGVRVVKYQIVEEVPLSDFVKEVELSKKTKSELTSILNGTANSAKIIQQYRKTFTKGYRELTKTERYKFLAILSQNHYELPPITISRRIHIYYVRLLEFYNKPHNTTFAGFASSELDRYNKEILYGSRDFEILTNITMNEIVTNPNLKLLLQTRRLPKERFEEYCEYMLREKERIHHADECVAAGYEILPKYKKQFYPYIIYSNIELALDLIEKDLQVRSYTSTLLLKSGYKIRTFDYNYREFDSIKKAREIFSKNEYKYI